MKWIGDLIRAAHGPARVLYAITAIGLFFLLMPTSWTHWLGMREALTMWRGWIALATVSSFSFGTASLVPAVMRFFREKAAIRARVRSLDSLSGGEKLLLGYCAARGRRTVLLSLDSTAGNVAGGLCQKGVMEQAAGTHNILAWPFSVPEFLWPSVTRRVDSLLGANWRSNVELVKEFARLDKQTSGRERVTY